MKQSDSIAKLAAALVKAQAKMVPVAKSSSNRFNKKYASLDTILEAVRPVLAEVGLVVVQGATLPTTDEAGRLSSINLETMLVHESGEWLSNTVFFPVGKTPVKEDGRQVGAEPMGADAAAAISYGRRYGLMALLALSTDEEETPQASSTTTRSQPKRTEKPAPAPAAAPKPTPAPAAPAPAPATVPQKAADRRIATPNGDRRLGDYSNAELVKLQERARDAGKKELENAIDEIFLDRENEALSRTESHA